MNQNFHVIGRLKKKLKYFQDFQTLYKRDCHMRIKVGIAIYQSLLKRYCRCHKILISLKGHFTINKRRSSYEQPGVETDPVK